MNLQDNIRLYELLTFAAQVNIYDLESLILCIVVAIIYIHKHMHPVVIDVIYMLYTHTHTPDVSATNRHPQGDLNTKEIYNII